MVGFIILACVLINSRQGGGGMVMVNGRLQPAATDPAEPTGDPGGNTGGETPEDPGGSLSTEPGQSGENGSGQTEPQEYVDSDQGNNGYGRYGDVGSSGGGSAETGPDGLTCDDFALFSGQYVEDGRDELVENVAAILVTNQTGRFLDFASLTYDVDGQTVTFVVTGLPAGRSAWVMAQDQAKATGSSVFTYVDSVTSYRDDVVAETDALTITSEGNVLSVRNNSTGTLENVCVYYRSVHSDGNFFGGITYLVSFGTLEPGASAESMAGHYDPDNSEIVRVGWQTG